MLKPITLNNVHECFYLKGYNSFYVHVQWKLIHTHTYTHTRARARAQAHNYLNIENKYLQNMKSI